MAAILIIEHDPSLAALLSAVVELAGATPLLELDPGGAAPDALILEPDAPGALETASALRAVNAGLPIVCVSARAPTAEIRAALEPALYFGKPFAVAELHAALQALL